MHLRNLNKVTGGMRHLGTPWVGVLGSDVPTTGEGGRPGLLGPEVVLNGWQANRVRIWIEASNFPGLFVADNTSWTASNLVDGTYQATGRVYLDDVDQGTKTLTLTVGGGVLSVSITGLEAAADVASAAVTIAFTGVGVTVSLAESAADVAAATLTIGPAPVEITASVALQEGAADVASAVLHIDPVGQVPPNLAPGKRRVPAGTQVPVKLAPFDVAEVDDVVFDFSAKIPTGDPILLVTITSEARFGTDPQVRPLLVGQHQVDGRIVLQRMSGAVASARTIYLVRAVATTVSGLQSVASAFVKVVRRL